MQNRYIPHNFQKEFFSGQAPTESLNTQDSEYVYERDWDMPAQSWEVPVERELPAKIGRCNENLLGQNFNARAKSS